MPSPRPESGAVVVVVLAFGDGSAYFGGKKFGGPRLPWNSQKTWAGTLNVPRRRRSTRCELAYRGEAGTATPWMAAALCGGGAALFAALAESLPTRLSDNLMVTAAVAAALIHFSVLPLLMA